MSITQPLSPPPAQSQDQTNQAWATLAQPLTKTNIDPVLALELRVRWLEALVLGLSSPASSSNAPTDTNGFDKGTKTSGDRGHKIQGSLRSLRAEKLREKERGKGKEAITTLARLTEDVKKRLDAIVETNEGLRKFMDTCTSFFRIPSSSLPITYSPDDQHAQYLTPTFALSGVIDVPLPSTPTSESPEGERNLGSSLLPIYENMSPQELEAYLVEMEPEIRAADRDMREIETLVGKGVTGAGKLGGEYLVFCRSLVGVHRKI